MTNIKNTDPIVVSNGVQQEITSEQWLMLSKEKQALYEPYLGSYYSSSRFTEDNLVQFQPWGEIKGRAGFLPTCTHYKLKVIPQPKPVEQPEVKGETVEVDEVKLAESLNVPVYETNMALSYQELAYFVHYRNVGKDADYLCIAKNCHSESWKVGEFYKIFDYEFEHMVPSKFKLQDSSLWSIGFASFILRASDQRHADEREVLVKRVAQLEMALKRIIDHDTFLLKHPLKKIATEALNQKA